MDSEEKALLKKLMAKVEKLKKTVEERNKVIEELTKDRKVEVSPSMQKHLKSQDRLTRLFLSSELKKQKLKQFLNRQEKLSKGAKKLRENYSFYDLVVFALKNKLLPSMKEPEGPIEGKDVKVYLN